MSLTKRGEYGEYIFKVGTGLIFRAGNKSTPEDIALAKAKGSIIELPPPNLEIHQLTAVQWDDYRTAVNKDIPSKGVLVRWSALHGLDPNYPSNLYCGFVDGKAASFNATYFSRGKKKNAWGRYVNFHLAYTFPEYRFHGFATQLSRFVEEEARKQGYHRLKSLCQSYAGFRLHLALGHGFYGIQAATAHRGKDGAGALVVDAPIKMDWQFPTDTAPIEARCCAEPAHLLSEKEVRAVLGGPFYGSVSKEELDRCFKKRPLRYR
jgi:GNAT superfamily N-acetyltransferase